MPLLYTLCAHAHAYPQAFPMLITCKPKRMPIYQAKGPGPEPGKKLLQPAERYHSGIKNRVLLPVHLFSWQGQKASREARRAPRRHEKGKGGGINKKTQTQISQTKQNKLAFRALSAQSCALCTMHAPFLLPPKLPRLLLFT